MIIKSKSGKILVQTGHKTVKGALEYCAAAGIDLANADLRRAKLSFANLDGLSAPGAVFWGADFTGSDIGFANLQKADLRNTTFKDSCLAETDLGGADLRGAYFSQTIMEGACLDDIHVSCPSFWTCDLQSAASFKNAAFYHRGEHILKFTAPPLVIRGLEQPLIIMEGQCLLGHRVYSAGSLSRDAQRKLKAVRNKIDGLLEQAPLPNAKTTYP